MNRILITGSNSFVGKNFLSNSKHSIIKEISLHDNNPEEINFNQYDTVLHVAAIVHQTNKIPESKYFEINTDLCLNVARNAKKQGVKQFVFLSSVKVYGNKQPLNTIWNEFSECLPDDTYGKSKLMAEEGLQKLEDKNFCITIIRCSLIYGVKVKANMLNIVRLVHRFPVLPLAKINNQRSFLSIENLVPLIDTIIEKRASGIFLATDEKAISTTSLVQLIAKHLHKNIVLFPLPQPLVWLGKKFFSDIFDRLFNSYEFDNTYTRKTLNYSPKLTIDEGIKNMMKFYNNKTNN